LLKRLGGCDETPVFETVDGKRGGVEEPDPSLVVGLNDLATLESRPIERDRREVTPPRLGYPPPRRATAGSTKFE
jgi:hypothetical protein